MAVYVRVLGPVSLEHESVERLLPSRQLRILVAMLVLWQPDRVSQGQLIDAIWGTDPPRSAATKIHGHVSVLRRMLGCTLTFHAHDNCPIETVADGYRLGAVDTDLHRFRELVARAQRLRADDRPAEAVDCLADAVALWRDDPCGEMREISPIAVRVVGLAETYLDVMEDFAGLAVRLGRGRQVVDPLRRLVMRHPYRERLLGHLMAALAQQGRVAEALRAYHDGRRRVCDELGLDPSPEVQQLHLDLLRGQVRPFVPMSAIGSQLG